MHKKVFTFSFISSNNYCTANKAPLGQLCFRENILVHNCLYIKKVPAHNSTKIRGKIEQVLLQKTFLQRNLDSTCTELLVFHYFDIYTYTNPACEARRKLRLRNLLGLALNYVINLRL